MKIVNITGGLGNQMFQFAFALALKNRYRDDEIRVDISHYCGYRLHNGYEIQRIFGQLIPAATFRELMSLSYYCPSYKVYRLLRKILPPRRTEILEKEDYVYDDDVLKVAGNMYYDGYWQSPKYFDHCREEIVTAFHFPDFMDEENQCFSMKILSSDSVSIHVRRGDYTCISNVSGICDLGYYARAVAEVKRRVVSPVFFVFSDDLDWCKRNLQPIVGECPINFISHNRGNDSYNDMHLMSLSKACIIANSSFSWWGAYLNKREDKIVVAPSRWVNNSESKDMYANSWICV